MDLSGILQKGARLRVGVIAVCWGAVSPGRGLFGYPEVELFPWSLSPGFYCCVLGPRMLGMLEMNSL